MPVVIEVVIEPGGLSLDTKLGDFRLPVLAVMLWPPPPPPPGVGSTTCFLFSFELVDEVEEAVEAVEEELKRLESTTGGGTAATLVTGGFSVDDGAML